ncbi:phage replisome organizer N-terminal domain-containing protein [Clostridium grantii]|uniref:Phage replisome organizer, putative, N-terminal region n=1 Tax=Clostridium grantii DSM 8605 TaxID=1121316 RepID=A0A1M5R0X2_9CLOT|nr:phage replisome organizer N-terminal domain-containing protein [Clostridium grantii]SHH20025.1 phage replisome organizer, putative, N-terminal region [Clostridium grantii DSM 8605]
MADVKWIKITTSIFDDEKIKLIDSMPESDGIFTIWIKLLVLAGKIYDEGYIYLDENIPFTDEMLAAIFNRPLNTIRLALDVFKKFKMIEILDNNFIFISNWGKHQSLDKLEKLKDQNRKRVARHRE